MALASLKGSQGKLWEAAAVTYHTWVYSRAGTFLVEELLFGQEGGWIEIIPVIYTAGETTKLSSVSLSWVRAIHIDTETSQMLELTTPALSVGPFPKPGVFCHCKHGGQECSLLLIAP